MTARIYRAVFVGGDGEMRVWQVGWWLQAVVCRQQPVGDTGRNLTTQECKLTEA